ncbi:MAG: sporulation protein YtxC [Clostridia bacterium]
MLTYAIGTNQYDIDLGGLLSRRLSQCGCVCGLASTDGSVTVTVQDGESVKLLADALTMLLCRDLQYFELTHYVDALPLSLSEKQAVLTSTLDMARSLEQPARIRDGLVRYLGEEHRLNLEGYMRFRMRDQVERWRESIDHAAAEQILRREYTELLGVLSSFVQTEEPQAGELSICIHPDGSCTLTDDMNAHIEYVDCSEDGIMSLLVGMAPTQLTVYDLSGGAGQRLTDAIRRVFAGRVKIYR